MAAAEVAKKIDILRLPCGSDIVIVGLRPRTERKHFALCRAKNHGQQFEQRALARTAFADKRQFGPWHDIELRYVETKPRATRLVKLDYIAYRIDGIAQGKASSSSG